MLPKALLVERGLPLETLMARQAGGASGILRVALATMRSTYPKLPHMSLAAARGAGDLIAQLVRLSLIELAGQSTAVTQREALKDRIRAYVSVNLRDPGLSIEQIAHALNCSKRHLHNAFSDEYQNVASHILDLRHKACLREFQQGGSKTRTITDIALSWGFNNLSHFSRVFRDRTGLRPRDFRREPFLNASGGKRKH
jgi:AraC-like DNA-binding protein